MAKTKPPSAPVKAVAAPAPAAPAPAARKKILVVDDHPLVRERVAELINQEPDLLVCGEAEDAHQALAAVAALRPDIAIVDITLKDTYGIELIKDIKNQFPRLPVLVLSMHEETLYAERALRAGARGYLNKQEATKKIIPAIRQVLGGQVYVSEKMASTLLQRVAGIRSLEPGGSPLDALSDRELEVFQLLGDGKPVREIARSLHISVKTVEAHREHIKQKLNLKSSAELIRYAVELNLSKA
jgi:DNA-binding NarL/FixJ family response regulator